MDTLFIFKNLFRFICIFIFISNSYSYSQSLGKNIPDSNFSIGRHDLLNRYIIAVGVSELKNEQTEAWRTEIIENDINAFVQFFKSGKAGNIPDKNTKILIKKDAAKSKIEESIKKFLTMAGKDDQVIIYLTGSGIRDTVIRGNVNLVCYNTDFKNESETSYSIHQLITLLRTYDKIKNIFLIMDMNPNINFGIGFISESRKKFLLNNWDILNNMKAKDRNDFLKNGIPVEDKNLVILTSCEFKEEPLVDTELKRSIFNYCFLKGMNGDCDAEKKNIVTINYLLDCTLNLVMRQTERRQHPGIFRGIMQDSTIFLRKTGN